MVKCGVKWRSESAERLCLVIELGIGRGEHISAFVLGFPIETEVINSIDDCIECVERRLGNGTNFIGYFLR